MPFDLFPKKAEYKEQKLSVNPKFVESITETYRSVTEGDYQSVAIIAMDSGDKHVVYDPARSVAKQIKKEQGAYNALIEILIDLYDDDPCRFDHHGYCQTHCWMATDPKCPHARIRDLGITKET